MADNATSNTEQTARPKDPAQLGKLWDQLERELPTDTHIDETHKDLTALQLLEAEPTASIFLKFVKENPEILKTFSSTSDGEYTFLVPVDGGWPPVGKSNSDPAGGWPPPDSTGKKVAGDPAGGWPPPDSTGKKIAGEDPAGGWPPPDSTGKKIASEDPAGGWPPPDSTGKKAVEGPDGWPPPSPPAKKEITGPDGWPPPSPPAKKEVTGPDGWPPPDPPAKIAGEEPAGGWPPPDSTGKKIATNDPAGGWPPPDSTGKKVAVEGPDGWPPAQPTGTKIAGDPAGGWPPPDSTGKKVVQGPEGWPPPAGKEAISHHIASPSRTDPGGWPPASNTALIQAINRVSQPGNDSSESEALSETASGWPPPTKANIAAPAEDKPDDGWPPPRKAGVAVDQPDDGWPPPRKADIAEPTDKSGEGWPPPSVPAQTIAGPVGDEPGKGWPPPSVPAQTIAGPVDDKPGKGWPPPATATQTIAGPVGDEPGRGWPPPSVPAQTIAGPVDNKPGKGWPPPADASTEPPSDKPGEGWPPPSKANLAEQTDSPDDGWPPPTRANLTASVDHPDDGWPPRTDSKKIVTSVDRPDDGWPPPHVPPPTDLLAHHIVPHFFTTQWLRNMANIPTLARNEVSNRPGMFTPSFDASTGGGVINKTIKILKSNVKVANGIVHFISAPLTRPVDLLTVVEQQPNVPDAIKKIVKEHNLLPADHEQTAFLPSVDAFNSLGDETVKFLSSADGAAYLTALVKYHIVPGATVYRTFIWPKNDIDQRITSGDALSPRIGTRNVQFETMLQDKEGKAQVVELAIHRHHGFIDLGFNKTVAAEEVDVPANNGSLHVLKRVLMPGSAGAAEGALSVEELKKAFDEFAL